MDWYKNAYPAQFSGEAAKWTKEITSYYLSMHYLNYYLLISSDK
jgi:hypothetical protein